MSEKALRISDSCLHLPKFAEAGIVLVLLVIHVTLAVGSMLHKSPTFDEGLNLSGGTIIWRYGDYRILPESGVMLQRYLTLPLIFMDEVKCPDGFQKSTGMDWSFRVGYDFLYKNGNNPEKIVFASRLMVVILSVFLGLTIYLWSRNLFGSPGAVVSLLLYAFSPSILAHARFATADLTVAFLLLLAVLLLWRLMRKVTPARIGWSVLALILLFMCKLSAVMIVPVYLVMVALRIMIRRPLPVNIFGFRINIPGRSQVRQLAVFLAVGIVYALLIWGAMWTAYSFRYSMLNPDLRGQALQVEAWKGFSGNDTFDRMISFTHRNRLVPESFIFGFSVLKTLMDYRVAFLNGELREGSWWYFYPYTILVKTPLPFLALLLLLVCYGSGWIVRKRLVSGKIGRRAAMRIYRLSPLFILVAIYLLFSVFSKMNIGHRHILPVYPPLFVLAGAAGSFFFRRNLYLGGAVALLLIGDVFTGVRAYPDYLAYFNYLAGGKANAYRHLVDSSLDWGQDLPMLKKWLDKHGNGQNVYLAYFGTASPDHYGIKAMLLSDTYDRVENRIFPLRGGIYAISATRLQLFINPKHAKWRTTDEREYRLLDREMRKLIIASRDTDSFRKIIAEKGDKYWGKVGNSWKQYRNRKLIAGLRRRKPDANIGGSILIFRLSDAEIRKLMNGKEQQ